MRAVADAFLKSAIQFAAQPYDQDVVKLAKANTAFRRVILTGEHLQIVIMSLEPGQNIGMETHSDTDQTLLFVKGKGQAKIGDLERPVKKGSLAFVPAGTQHDFTNTGNKQLKLVTVYSPPEHESGTVELTKPNAK